MILDKIVTYKKMKVKKEKEITPINHIISSIENCKERRNFKRAFEKVKGLSIIAEIKKASPSKGIIKNNFNPMEIAIAYTENKAEAISILTEDKFFRGDNSYLNVVRNVTSAPLLRKDFIIDPYQIYQSKILGADAILLIVSILSKTQLIEFQKIARSLGLFCLIEVHNRAELEIALEADSEIIGINNRNLKTFKTSLSTTENLIKHIPKSKIIISESGINTRQNIKFLETLGVNGVLIGESFMRASCINDKFKEFRGE
ncbi:indole-3-glycerol phosphate synthase TrpC [Maledivibacter halophilus]|uniref:Indole-3-glycerol phosphate synthase n=1 Tax=Maledivibacter halophilus TaxID=36842 RepID=A0A1T5LZA5_9FIRM|nr:indole-3-glycerol phosphate synthase TrpC [Maledivibacter halophilus]SKC80888.1 indole-3-glycerol phosphate synthase [Maledivibacter halophilus]